MWLRGGQALKTSECRLVTHADGTYERRDCCCYVVVRMYRDAWPNRRVIARGLTLGEAQAHCNDPETSSSTCVGAAGKRRTRRMGAWFDGYEHGR